MHLFGHFHIAQNPVPNFEPDTSQAVKAKGFGFYGRRDWYRRILFPGKDKDEPMSYTSRCYVLITLHQAC